MWCFHCKYCCDFSFLFVFFLLLFVCFTWGGWAAAQYSSSHPQRWSLASSRLEIWKWLYNILWGDDVPNLNFDCYQWFMFKKGTCFRGGWYPTSQVGTGQASPQPPSARSCSSSETCRGTSPNVAEPARHLVGLTQKYGFTKPLERRSAGRLGWGLGRFWGAGRGGWSCRSQEPPAGGTLTAQRFVQSRSGKGNF